ncbi:MFS transporter [Anaerosalibacter bizertensis]|uniref:MFS transporter n=1 Tax=Anaerosalibacter bizertensis TaxID=932217 RepID=A0A9Q4AC78_9FIRM|nr:MFS transporter [Anaerosalibacter bizertensis]MBV1818633.1 MFS transporter [Bacteroidales bacterium MSK.15.36]MCG4564930.1 MFS transporter [Anaerosalibacter bizertensis]
MDRLYDLRRCLYYISFSLSFIGFMLPIYALDVGASVMEVGMLYSVFSLISIIIRPKVGNLLDRRGRKIGLFIGVVLYCLVNFLLLIGRDFKYLFLTRIFQSIGASFLWISVDTMVSDVSYAGNRSENFGSISQAIGRGDFIGCIIGLGIFFSKYFNEPFKVVFTLYFIFSLISLYICIFKIEETLCYKRDIRTKSYIKEKKATKFILIAGFIFYIFSLVFPLYIIYLKEYITGNLYLIGLVFLPGEAFQLFLPRRFGILADKYDRRKIVILGLFFLGVLQLFVPFIKDYFEFLIIYTLVSLIFMLIDPAASGLVIEYIGDGKRGESYGLYSLAGGVGGTLGPLAGTYYYEHIGGETIFIIGGILLIFVSGIINYSLRKKQSVKYKF